MRQTFEAAAKRPGVETDDFSRDEVRLANRNHGAMLELLAHEVTPTGAHYLLTHFDVPVLDPSAHRLEFKGAFAAPFALDMAQIQALPQITQPVTLECAGNGRAAGLVPRAASMPWIYEAVGTAMWTGTPLWPLIERAGPLPDAIEISFTGADEGFDRGHRHAFGRALTLPQIKQLDVMLVWGMNGQPLLPQHGAPLRIIVPGWYGMASVKWLTEVTALAEPYAGFQQVETYRLRQTPDDPGVPVTTLRPKSLMIPPGLPDWHTRRRYLKPGAVEIAGRAWSGAGVPIVKVELGDGTGWQEAALTGRAGRYAWTGWRATWQATPGAHRLRVRATDAEGQSQPLEPPWDVSGFCNNACQEVEVFVPQTA